MFEDRILKYISLISTDSNAEDFKDEYKNGRKYGKIVLGSNHLFIKNLFCTYYIGLDDLKYCFRRVMLVPAKRKSELRVESLVIADDDRELAVVQLPGRNAALELFDELKKCAVNASFSCPQKFAAKGDA